MDENLPAHASGHANVVNDDDRDGASLLPWLLVPIMALAGYVAYQWQYQRQQEPARVEAERSPEPVASREKSVLIRQPAPGEPQRGEDAARPGPATTRAAVALSSGPMRELEAIPAPAATNAATTNLSATSAPVTNARDVRSSVLPGQAGLVEALRKGQLRPGSGADLARWKGRYAESAHRAPGNAFDEHTAHMDSYVIQGDFEIPGDLYGANAVIFILEPRVPYPRGNSGHSPILDLGSGACMGALCGMILQ